LIFELALPWEGKTPALLVVSTGDEQFYKEAFDIFRKNHSFELPHPDRSSSSMSDTAMQSILRLDVEYVVVTALSVLVY